MAGGVFVRLRARLLLAGLLVWLLAPARPPPEAGAQAACGFALGFAALHARIPAVVGDCLEDERHDPATGDGLQRTTGGLLVWRKADNHTAFTDGSRTWVDGPFGLQVRRNAERFDWEVTVGRAEALARISEAPPGSSEGFLRIDTKEAKLTTWGEWDRASNPGGCTVVPDRADLYWVVLVRGEIGWATIAARGVAPSGGLVVDAATGMVRSFFGGRDDAFARLVDRDPGAAGGRILSGDDVPSCSMPALGAPIMPTIPRGGVPSPPSPTSPAAAGVVAPPTVGTRFNPARHYRLAAAPDFWLEGDAPFRRNDAGLRQRLIDALDAEVAVERVAYAARPFDRQPTVVVVFALGDRPLHAFVYRPDEGRVYVTEDEIAFAPRLAEPSVPPSRQRALDTAMRAVNKTRGTA